MCWGELNKPMISKIKKIRSECLQNNPDFKAYRFGSNRFVINKKFDSEQFRKEILNPSTLLEKSEILKDSRTTKAGLTKLEDETTVFIKKYNYKGLKFGLKYLLRKARAFRAWQSAWALECCGVPTPVNIAAFSFRKFGWYKSAYLITEVMDNLIELLDFYREMVASTDLQVQYADEVTKMLSEIHEKGISHGDLKLSNIYVQKSDEVYSFGLWDLDGTKFHGKPLGVQKRSAELARLIASYVELGMRIDIKVNSEKAVDLFLSAYEMHSGVNLKSPELVGKIENYIEKSHSRIMRKKRKNK